jgi:hypothetical protein
LFGVLVMSGLTLIEFIPPYIRMAMQLMYRTFLGSKATQSALIIRMLHNMSAKQGRIMNSHKSKAQIKVSWSRGPTPLLFLRGFISRVFLCVFSPRVHPGVLLPRSAQPFVQLHKLNVGEILRPLDDFANFNEFFYRELKPGCREIAFLDDPDVSGLLRVTVEVWVWFGCVWVK